MRRTPTSMSDLMGDYSSLVPRAKFNPLIHPLIKLRLLPPRHQVRIGIRCAGHQMAGRLPTLEVRARRAIRMPAFGWTTSRVHHARSSAVGPSGTLPAPSEKSIYSEHIRTQLQFSGRSVGMAKVSDELQLRF